MDTEERRAIFTNILPEEEFVDRRIHKSEFLDPESDSDHDDLDFIDRYDSTGRVLRNEMSIKTETAMNRSSRGDKSFSPDTKRTGPSPPFSPNATVSKPSTDRLLSRIPTST